MPLFFYYLFRAILSELCDTQKFSDGQTRANLNAPTQSPKIMVKNDTYSLPLLHKHIHVHTKRY